MKGRGGRTHIAHDLIHFDRELYSDGPKSLKVVVVALESTSLDDKKIRQIKMSLSTLSTWIIVFYTSKILSHQVDFVKTKVF